MNAPSPQASSRTRTNWTIAIGVLVVVLAGAWVGIVAGRLAHRAPRASGLRVAVVPVDASAVEQAPGLDRFVAGLLEWALARAFAGPGSADAGGRSERHVVPLPVVLSKVEVMKRGGRDGGAVEAAAILDVDLVVTGRVVPRAAALELTLDVGEPGSVGRTVVVSVPGQDPVSEVLAAGPALLQAMNVQVSDFGRPTSSVRAYGAFTHGLERFEAGELRQALERFTEATAEDPGFGDAHAWRAVTLTLLRDASPEDAAALALTLQTAMARRGSMAPREQLLTQALHAWTAWRAGLPEGGSPRDASPGVASPGDRAQRGEEVFKALRALTVRFPEERLGHLLLGRAYVQIMNGPTEALRHLENARRLSPTWFPTVAELVDTWLKMGDRKHATAEIRGYLVYRKDDETAVALLRALGG